MAEIKVTYETLFDLLRREKGRNELQQLDSSFYEDVSLYLKEKIDSLSSSSSRGEQEKINIQLKNVKKILRELYELREKKIINLATSKVRTNSNLIDTSKLLSKEKELFDEACELFSKFKEKILEDVLRGEMVGSGKPSVSSGEVVKEEPKKSVSAESEDVSSSDVVGVRILHDLPKFLGVDKKIYGPFKKGDETKMPFGTAKLLLDKKRAERI